MGLYKSYMGWTAVVFTFVLVFLVLRKLSVKLVIALIYLVVIAVVAYFILANFFPEYLPFGTETYAISANSNNVIGSIGRFYFSDALALGAKTKINGNTARPIIVNRAFYLLFALPKNLAKNTNVSLDFEFIVNDSKPTNIYINKELVYFKMVNYSLLSENSRDYIYSTNGIYNQANLTLLSSYNTTEELLYNKFNGLGVLSFRRLDFTSVNKSYNIIAITKQVKNYSLVVVPKEIYNKATGLLRIERNFTLSSSGLNIPLQVSDANYVYFKSVKLTPVSN